MAAPKKKNESSPEFRVSVREVVAFCFPPEDLLPGGGVEDMLAGGRAHRSRQEQQTGETERPIRHSFSLRGETVELYGRMDAFTDGPTPLVEEKGHKNVHLVGDCLRVGNLRSVVWRAYETAMKI